MALADSTVTRLYRCHNEECQCEIVYVQKLSENFRKKCPFCKKRSLTIKNGSMNMTFMFDVNKVKTFGMQSQKNMEMDEKLGKKRKEKETPWFRKNKKIDYGVLKDPIKYVRTGEK